MKPTNRRALSLQRTTLRNLSESELAAADGGAPSIITLPTLPPTIFPPCGTMTVTILPRQCITGPSVCNPSICPPGACLP